MSEYYRQLAIQVIGAFAGGMIAVVLGNFIVTAVRYFKARMDYW